MYRNLESFNYLIEILSTIKPDYLKQIFKQQNILDILVIYSAFKNDYRYIKDFEEFMDPYFYINPIRMDNHYLLSKLNINNNEFIKFISRYSHSSLFYLSILNNSCKVLDQLYEKMSFSDLKTHFKLNTNQVKIGLNIALLISKNKDLIINNNDVFINNQQEITYIAKNFVNINDFTLINNEFYISNYLSLIENSIIQHNEALFHFLNEKITSFQSNFLKLRYSNDSNILQLLIEHNEYKMFSYLTQIFGKESIKSFIEEEYNNCNSALTLAANLKSFNMFIFLIDYFTSDYVFQILITHSYFFNDLLILSQKDKKFKEFLTFYCPSFLINYSICNGITFLIKESLKYHEEMFTYRTNYENFSKNLVQKEENNFLKTQNIFTSNIENYINTIFAFIFAKKHCLDKDSIPLFNKKNDKKLSRLLLYYFINEFNILPNRDFFLQLFKENSLDEIILLDLFYYLENLNYPLIKLSEFYNKNQIGIKLCTLNKLSDQIPLENSDIEKIKTVNLNIFNDSYELIKEDFKTNHIYFLLSIFNYNMLPLIIYSDNNYQFNDLYLLNQFKENESKNLNDLKLLIRYYFNTPQLITQQLTTKGILFSKADTPKEKNKEEVEEDETSFENESNNEIQLLEINQTNNYSDLAKFFINNVSRSCFNSEYITNRVELSYLISANLPQKIQNYDMKTLQDLFRNYIIIFNNIIKDDFKFYSEFFNKNESNIVCYNEIDFDSYFQEIFNQIMTKAKKFFSQVKNSFYKVDLQGLGDKFSTYFSLYINTKSYIKADSHNDKFNHFIEIFFNFCNLISIMINMIIDIDTTIRKFELFNFMNIKFELLSSSVKIDRLNQIIDNNINEILNHIIDKNIEINFIIPLEIDNDYFNFVDSIFNLNIKLFFQKFNELLINLDNIWSLSKKYLIKFINPIESFDHSDYNYERFWDEYTGVLRLKYELLFYINESKSGKFSYTEAEKCDFMLQFHAYLNSSVGISSLLNLTKSESHLSHNDKLINEIENFFNNILNYEIYPLRNYLQEYFHNKKIPHEYKKYDSNVINFFYSNNEFNEFLDLLTYRLISLKNINLKFDKIQLNLDFHEIENILSNFLELNGKVFNGIINKQDLYCIFYTKHNCIWYLIEFLLELSMYTEDRITKFLINFNTAKILDTNFDKYSPSNLSSTIRNNLNIIDQLFFVNSISIKRMEVNNEECMKIEIEIYYDINNSDYLEKEFKDIHEFLKKSFKNKELNDDLIKEFIQNENLRNILIKSIQGISE